MAATLHYRITCDNRLAIPFRAEKQLCIAWKLVPADTITVARRYAFEDEGWISVQEGMKVVDYCPSCAVEQLEGTDLLALRTGRSTHRRKDNIPFMRRP